MEAAGEIAQGGNAQVESMVQDEGAKTSVKARAAGSDELFRLYALVVADPQDEIIECQRTVRPVRRGQSRQKTVASQDTRIFRTTLQPVTVHLLVDACQNEQSIGCSGLVQFASEQAQGKIRSEPGDGGEAKIGAMTAVREFGWVIDQVRAYGIEMGTMVMQIAPNRTRI